MKALHDVNPPVDDAEKYLTEDEQESFAHSVPGAVDAYLDGGKGCPLNDWRLDRRAHDYMMWLWTMKQRKEKEALAKQAEKDFQRYVKDINKAIEKLKEELAKEKKPSYAYWKRLYNSDREKYKHEKQKVAERVIEILDSQFRGIKNQVEVIDVSTLMTWERYMGGTQGWFNLPNRKLDFSMRVDLSDRKFKTTLPGLSNFYFVGVWATAMGSLAHNASSGKTIIRRICKKDGRKFTAQYLEKPLIPSQREYEEVANGESVC